MFNKASLQGEEIKSEYSPPQRGFSKVMKSSREAISIFFTTGKRYLGFQVNIHS